MKHWLIGMLLCASSPVWAQDPVYTCDFEDSAERTRWELNPARDAATQQKFENKWYIGKPGNFSPTGNNGLYISSETDGDSAVYSANATMFVAASREMDASLPAGDYNLYFDWQCNGKSYTGEGFYVCWVPVTTKTNGASGVGGIPGWVTNDTILGEEYLFSNIGAWNNAKISFHHDGTPRKLVFLWFSTRGKAVNPSACIDNIELRPASAASCPTPTQITHTIQHDTVILRWRGTADRYEVRCYNYTTGKWFTTENVTSPTCTIPNTQEGVYGFFLRAYCGDDHASDYVRYVQYIYHQGVYCIDYMDLNNSNCYTGTYANPFQNRSKVDYGYGSPNSRHTLHYMPNEYDANTGNQLRTVPEGYKVSVRLGDENGGGNGEGVEYKYKIASGETSILKIKYAMVLPDPHPEDVTSNPQFWLDIYCNGKKIPHDCGYTLFHGAEGEGWQDGDHSRGQKWMFRDWTEFSINLRDYVGQTLTIRLATTDCKPSAHPGYAYFVLDCESGEMTGLNCGEDNPTTTFQAPDGFDYVWYLPDNPFDTLGTEQEFRIQPMDTLVYNVNVINKTNHNCWYTLSVCGMPRIPTPIISQADVQAIRCENVVTLKQASCVRRQNMLTGELEVTDEPVTSLVWDFGDGTTLRSLDQEVTHVYPNTGGNYTLSLTAGVSDEVCTITTTYPLNLPDLSSPTTEVEEHVCRNDYPFGYPYGGTYFWEDADSLFTFISTQTGCDSLCHLRLKFHEPGPYYVSDTICEGYTYQFFDRELTSSVQIDTTVESSIGCDSIVSLSLFVDPTLEVVHPDTLQICPEDEVLYIPYSIVNGRMEAIELHFDEEAYTSGFDSVYTFDASDPIAIDIPASLIPNRYQAMLQYITPYCEMPAVPVCIELGYSSSIIYQSNGILALMNSDYNGGYGFVSYQWYRDGEPIAGATGPNLSMTDDDRGHIYSVETVRANDSVQLQTCPVVYGLTALDPSIVAESDLPLQIYTPLGIRLGECVDIQQLYTLPAGIYLLSNEKKTFKIIR